MASIVITIETDGAAFHEGFPEPKKTDPGYEVARILRMLAHSYEYGGYGSKVVLSDINSNVCGKVEVIE